MDRRRFLIGGSALVAAAGMPPALAATPLYTAEFCCSTVFPLFLATGDSLVIGFSRPLAERTSVRLLATRATSISSFEQLLEVAFTEQRESFVEEKADGRRH